MTSLQVAWRAFQKKLHVMPRKRKLLWVVILFLVTDWFLVDRFLIYGTITDKVTGQPISNAIVTFTIRGDRPFMPWPHGYHNNSVCIRSYVRQTDEHGRYGLFALALNSIMFNKQVDVHIFKPAYYLDQEYFERDPGGKVYAGLLGRPTITNVELTSDRGDRWSFRGAGRDTGPYTLDATNPLYQRTMSSALTGTFYAIETDFFCGAEIWSTYFSILDYGIKTAVTDEEKDFVKGKCRDLSKIAGVTLPEAELHRLKILRKPRPKPIYDFPYQCDSLFQDAGKHANTQR